mgnify:FL=1
MAFTDKTLEDMLREIGVKTTLISDIIIPAMHPQFPKSFWRLPPSAYEGYSLTGREFIRDLWYVVDVELGYSGCNKILQRVKARRGPRKSNVEPGRPPLGREPIGMALENAFFHGNKENPNLPVSLMGFEGTNGVVASVKDSGDGFDFKQTISKFFSWKKARYCDRELYKFYTRMAMGFASYKKESVEVSFEEGGRRVNMLFMDSNKGE